MSPLGTILLLAAVALGGSEAGDGLRRRLRRQNAIVDSFENAARSGEWVNPSSGSRLANADAFATNLENTRNRLNQEGRNPVGWSDRIDRARQQVEDLNGNGGRASSGSSRLNGNNWRGNNGQQQQQQLPRDDYNNNNNRGRYNDNTYDTGRSSNAGYRTGNNAAAAGTGTGTSSDQAGSGGFFAGGLFGGGRSLIGGFINSIGQGISHAVTGVSRALANKWDTKVAAFRGIASNTIRAGLAHPRFAFEALQNVFGGGGR